MLVKDRAASGIGASTLPRVWHSIDWKATAHRVRNLRRRIYRASQLQQPNRVRSLMKLMLRSRANLYAAVRRVTQDNPGKRTPGVDGQLARTATERDQLIQQMGRYTLGRVKPTRRIYIPKRNGKTRPLGIPCLVDRVAQAMVKNALEPSWEARFEPHSYGFRPGRSAHDALQYTWTCLRASCKRPWVLDADIQGAFDQISHTFLMQSLGNIPGRALIHAWLKAGYLEAGSWSATERGTPQGGIISPLLLNIALHGLENDLHQHFRYHRPRNTPRIRYTAKGARYRIVRYADDFAIMAETRLEIERIVPFISSGLEKRGLQFHPDKTRIVHIDDGFDFLGMTLRRFKGHCLTKPDKNRVVEQLRSIRCWLKQPPSMTPEGVIRQLNPILRGWAQYYQPGVSKDTLQWMSHQLWRALWRWCLRRHPQKGKRWVRQKYYRTLQGRQWRFATEVKDGRGKRKMLRLFDLGDMPIRRHILVRDTYAPDDAAQAAYGEQRQRQRSRLYWGQDKQPGRIARAQAGRCPQCGELILNGEKLHLHHRHPVQQGGKDTDDNLVWLHKVCHQQIHARP
ncbi:putative RNA-directed DNA polymerase [Candidatus Glomeribacter gigasporarum BEG34]|uniref:Putative RNA-directed DNA polymerase n=1 Tax=Candidatus Glomeribacter gigasporarum BEG34 TaxID=1070319 RepID=G2JBF0_9BURK|nr:group II intron reverse transcriptase/maturase [Candidatus Glomeribacter gigasporarum]CCD30104.1 putative RNA-directed DNA polymerase [Candidatus Glomeribacter gigasporarum BEG34]